MMENWRTSWEQGQRGRQRGWRGEVSDINFFFRLQKKRKKRQRRKRSRKKKRRRNKKVGSSPTSESTRANALTSSKRKHAHHHHTENNNERFPLLFITTLQHTHIIQNKNRKARQGAGVVREEEKGEESGRHFGALCHATQRARQCRLQLVCVRSFRFACVVFSGRVTCCHVLSRDVTWGWNLSLLLTVVLLLF